ncbi:MAG: XdhC/CoxI family protein [Bryobacteraceae bacterium]
MKDLEQIIELWRRSERAGESAVLATVVKTRGSCYRLPGARLLLTSRGERYGSISGGCLEEDLIKKAWWLTESGPVIRRYDTTPDGEIASGYGLGCSGVIHVLLERLTPGNAPVLQLIGDVHSERRPAVIAHVLEPSSSAGQRLIIDTAGNVTHNIPDPDLANWLEEQSRNQPRPFNEFFLETLTPAIRLLIFGAGDDAVPLTRLAKFLGWRVCVLDGRAHYARPEKFPEADQVILRQPEEPAPGIDPWTAAVLMTHSYSQDLDILRELSSQPLRYFGILGPRTRASQLLTDAGLQPERPAPELHSPMGLDIGADGPEQVALAVVAEIQATFNGRDGGSLRSRSGSIHAPDTDETDLCASRRSVCAFV